MSCAETLVPPDVFVVSTPGLVAPLPQLCWDLTPSMVLLQKVMESPILPHHIRKLVFFVAITAGLDAGPVFSHSCPHSGSWICSPCEPGNGTERTEALCKWIWEVPHEISSHGKPFLCGEVSPVVLGGCFLPPQYLSPSLSGVGRTWKQLAKWRAGISGSLFTYRSWCLHSWYWRAWSSSVTRRFPVLFAKIS